uniref:Uncharacterized protein n=1 Tax=Mola mola TaxID=94237 RepID=A0A3Q3WJE2_MOLML
QFLYPFYFMSFPCQCLHVIAVPQQCPDWRSDNSESSLLLKCLPLPHSVQWYRQINPQLWTTENVLEWISGHVESNKLDASTLSLACCAMDGHTLCQMTRDHMIEVFGLQLGPHLYQSLQEYNTKYGKPLSKHLTIKLQMFDLDVYVHASIYLAHCALLFAAPRGTHLWEFIRDILIYPEKNQGLMKWEDRREGVFKFLKSEAVAQMWGQKKKNSSMTYEKLSRAMRYYYKREILERVDGRRLVYKFGKNSSGWKIEEIGTGM